ncbi:MAG: glycosyltransferase family 39 protein [Deltaproteobacteria bacterium]|nr:glycosyltransferase family 39 protein [Deltaproteobacteria bacterium]
MSAYMYFALLSERDGRFYIYSILSGICLGLAMLSKYTAFFVIISSLMFWKKYRKDSELTKKLVYIPVFTAAIVYIPNFIYNLENGFRSYLFQISHATSNTQFNPLTTALPFLLSQLFIFSPFLFVFFLLNFQKLRKETDPKKYLLFLMTIVPLSVFLILSLFKHIEANWAAFAFIPLIILNIPDAAKSGFRYIPTAVYQALVFLLIILHINFSILPLKPENDPLTQIKDWGKTYEMIKDNLPENRTIVTFRYQLSSVLYYYSNKKLTSLCLDKRFVKGEIGLSEASDWVMVDFFPAKTAGDIALNICPDRTIRIPLVISKNLNIIRRIDIIYCSKNEERRN